MNVKELIEILSKVNPELEVVMSMNMEYSCTVDAGMIGVTEYPRLGVGPQLEINNTFSAPRVVSSLATEEE